MVSPALVDCALTLTNAIPAFTLAHLPPESRVRILSGHFLAIAEMDIPAQRALISTSALRARTTALQLGASAQTMRVHSLAHVLLAFRALGCSVSILTSAPNFPAVAHPALFARTRLAPFLAIATSDILLFPTFAATQTNVFRATTALSAAPHVSTQQDHSLARAMLAMLELA